MTGGALYAALRSGLGRLARSVLKHHAALGLVALALACEVVTVLLFYPGYMSMDSTTQLTEARSLVLSDHHPVLMALLWHATDKILPGPAGMLLLTTTLYWAGLAAIFASLRWPLWLRMAALIGVGFYPPIFCVVGCIWKDTLMMAALFAAIGCFLGFERRKSRLLLVLGILFTICGLELRHNAIAATWPVLLLPLLEMSRLRRFKLPWRLLASSAASIVATGVVALALSKAFAPFVAPVHFWQLIATFDLAGMSLQKGEMLMDRTTSPLNRGIGIREVKKSYHADNHMTLYRCRATRGRKCKSVFYRTVDEAELATLSKHWKQTVLHNPGAYLAERYRVYRRVVGIDQATKLWYLGPRGVARDYPLPRAAMARLKWFQSVSRTAWFSVWIYVALNAVVGVAGLVFYARTRSALPMVLAASGLCYSLSLFFGAGAPDYRYSTWTVATGVVALLCVLQSFRRSELPVPSASESGPSSPAKGWLRGALHRSSTGS